MRWLLASNNKHKVEEIQSILGPFDIQLITMDEAGLGDMDIEETGTTFEENALIKAQAIFAHTGIPTLADDSGLMVDALGGAPGVYSARYSGFPKSDARNNEKLLTDLAEVPEPDRTARFVCVLAYVDGAERFTLRGEAEGRILFVQAGTGGFGYDPLFYSFEAHKSFAELSADEKNQLSHRAKALKKLRERLLGGPVA